MKKSCYTGIDVGSSFTKVVIMNREKEIIGYSLERSGVDFEISSNQCLDKALEMAGCGRDDMAAAISTGYGRKNVKFRSDTKTEIGCHAKGCYYYFPEAITIIDIGGQDNKIIKLNKEGQRLDFKMNRKCAAGTGAFLEEMSLRLNIPLDDFNDLAMKSAESVKINSFCTVFAGTEVLEHIRAGKKVQDIIKGLFFSVIKRVVEMDSISGRAVATGGVVANNPYIVNLATEITGKDYSVPEHPQLTGAIGAALFAIDYAHDKDNETGKE